MISSLHRPTLAKVDLSAISENIEQVVSHIPKQVQTFAVVKANAYGHGAVEVAKHVSKQVDGFCVSNLDEALELRQAGLEQPILILGVVLPDEVPLAIQENITLTVASLEWLEMTKNQGLDLTGLTCHIKVDSGMGRIGVRSQGDADSLIAGLKSLGANVEGIFTHFATADEADDSKFKRQLVFFTDLVNNLVDRPRLVHASNSATSIWHAETVFNAVRLGVVIYGLNPSGSALDLPYNIRPAFKLGDSTCFMLRPCQQVKMWVMVQRIRRQLMRLLEPFRLAMRMVGPEIYKVSTLLWMASFVLLLGVCLWTRSLFDFLRFIP